MVMASRRVDAIMLAWMTVLKMPLIVEFGQHAKLCGAMYESRACLRQHRTKQFLLTKVVCPPNPLLVLHLARHFFSLD